jgi:uncharacterized YccA/Bax inhibitor family protein
MGIGFSLFVVAIAALNLILDFDMIDRLVHGRSKIYGMVWCIWIISYREFGYHLEILRLLSKLSSRN